jgi:hypothetical protein
MSEDDFTLDLATLIEEGLHNDLSPYLIIGFLETTKQSLINQLLEVEDECK